MSNEKTPTLQCQDCGQRGNEVDFVPAVNVERRHTMGDVYSDLECTECGALVLPINAIGDPWTHDEVQFPRLLCEIQMTQSLDLAELGDSMNLSEAHLDELFERAKSAHRQYLDTLSVGKAHEEGV